MNGDNDTDIRLVKEALSANVDALRGFKRILAEFEHFASEAYWKTHCSVPLPGGRCNAVVTSRTCREGHTLGPG